MAQVNESNFVEAVKGLQGGLRGGMEREGGRSRREGGFVGERLSTLACPTSAYVCSFPQVLEFPTGTAGDGMNDVS